MTQPGFQFEGSLFSQEQAELLGRLLATLTPDQMLWLGGYLAGVRSGRESGAYGFEVQGQTATSSPLPLASAPSAPEITVLYGSQTGNSKYVAKDLTQRLQQRGLQATLCCMNEYKTTNLRKAETLLIVVSTHGEGDPPDNALPFFEFLHSKRAPRLEGLRYAVLGLGDITYKNFCQVGKDFDQRLEELGARRLHARADCDVDYHEPAEAWMEGVLGALSEHERLVSGKEKTSCGCHDEGCSSGKCGPSLVTLNVAPTSGGPTTYGRTRPYHAEVLENFALNGRGSDKETRHLKLLIEGSGMRFEPGDSLGICPQNHPELVDGLIREMGWNAEELVPVGKEERPLYEALSKHYEISVLTKPLLQQASAFSQDGLHDLLREDPDDNVWDYIRGRDLLDLVRDFSLSRPPARDFVGMLRKLPARLYSIASSCTANPSEVDLTIAAVRYFAHNRDRFGTCSVHCAERVQPGETLPVYVHSNPNFRMPADPSAPMIMVGPGTGVAPFRAFIDEREALSAQGKNWLFFGDRRFRTDFLYQTDWQRWLKVGVLTRMDVAFSRDTDQKVYVQHRMQERGRDIFAWLEEGAYFYVCGDEKHMAPDVHVALESIVEREGGMSQEAAKAYIADLQRQGRYQRDVY